MRTRHLFKIGCFALVLHARKACRQTTQVSKFRTCQTSEVRIPDGHEITRFDTFGILRLGWFDGKPQGLRSFQQSAEKNVIVKKEEIQKVFKISFCFKLKFFLNVKNELF